MIFSIQQKLLFFSVITFFTLSGCSTTNRVETNPQPSNVAVNKKPKSLEEIAQQTTVNISGKGSGSGVIIGKKSNTYYVLTAKHVVGIPPGKLEDDYVIKTVKEKYTIDYNRVKKIPKFDIAIAEFNSNTNYPVANLSKNLYLDQTVFISGWRECLDKDKKKFNKKYEFNKGMVLKIVSSPNAVEVTISDTKNSNKDKIIDFQEGYRVKYTNPTIRGLSGSPIFDQAGNIVAIHGKPGDDRYQDELKNCPILNKSFGDNWGIPVNEFLDLIQDLGIPVQVAQSSPEGNNSVKYTDKKSEPESSGELFKRPEP